ncbi:MAG: hypothetical protein ACOYYS_03780 [Chloroflexota bacterium]
MKHLRLLVFIVFFLGGGVTLYLGVEYHLPPLTGLGMAGFSGGLIFLGAETIIKRKSVESDTDTGHVATYRGCSAVLSGILWVVLGIILGVLAVPVALGMHEALFGWLAVHPGLALLAFGLAAVAYGGHTLLGSEEQKASVWAFLGSLPARVFALVILLIGLALLAAGALEIVFPVLFDGLMAAVQAWWHDLQCQMAPYLCEGGG